MIVDVHYEFDGLRLVVEALAALKLILLCQRLFHGLMHCNLGYFHVIVLREVLSVSCIMKGAFYTLRAVARLLVVL